MVDDPVRSRIDEVDGADYAEAMSSLAAALHAVLDLYDDSLDYPFTSERGAGYAMALRTARVAIAAAVGVKL